MSGPSFKQLTHNTMKKLLLSISLSLGFFSLSQAQCSVEANDTLLPSYNYIVNAVNPTGTPPFVYHWTLTDGNGMQLPFATNLAGDSMFIDAMTLQNNYGCVIYQLCMTDADSCTTCAIDTSALQVPYQCYSQFITSIVGENQVSIMLVSTMPQFLIMGQMILWTDGSGQGQMYPYSGSPEVITYNPGPSETSDKFLCCMQTMAINGGCLFCDSVPFRTSTLGLAELSSEKLRISPNPASSVTKIASHLPIESVQLYNSVGQKVKIDYLLEGKSALLDLAKLPKGVYVVEIMTASGVLKERISRE